MYHRTILPNLYSVSVNMQRVHPHELGQSTSVVGGSSDRIIDCMPLRTQDTSRSYLYSHTHIPSTCSRTLIPT